MLRLAIFLILISLGQPAFGATITCINAFDGEGSFEEEVADVGANLFETIETTRDVDPSSILGIALVVVSTVGIDNFINLYETSATSSACAARDGMGRRAIWVNPDWFEEFSQGDYWARFGIIAHEVGHHLNDHSDAGTSDRWQREYQADKFVGRAVRIIGGSLDDAKRAVEMTGERGSHSHPSRSVRIAAVTDGYNMTFPVPRSVVVLTTPEAAEESRANPARVNVLGSLGWSYVGVFQDDVWGERVFYQLDGEPDDLPKVGDVIKASTDVNVRTGYPFYDGKEWIWPEVVGIVGQNNVVRVLDVKTVPNGFIWVEVERIDGGEDTGSEDEGDVSGLLWFEPSS